jgi:prolyl oligopeptidase
MRISRWYALSICALYCMSCNSQRETTASIYPTTSKVDTVDNYFGEKVSDPYRWLENDTSEATGEWVKSQNEVTAAYLQNINYRDRIKERLEKIFNYERLSKPFKEGDYYYFYKNDGLQNHNVLYRKKGIDGSPEIFLDPNTFSKDATTGLASISFTTDGSLAAYLISEGGSDWRKAIVMKTSDRTIVEDTLVDIKFSGLAWKSLKAVSYPQKLNIIIYFTINSELPKGVTN